MTKFVRIFFVGAVILGVMTVGNLRAQAQIQNAGIPQFMPIGTWQVEPTSFSNIRGLSNIKLPCMMMTSFDNGYIVRLSGGEQNLLAMAIDFRQSVFHQGRKYPATISIDGTYSQQATATAFSESVLIFNLRPLSRFYQVMQQAGTMQLDIEGNTMQFMMGGLNHAFERLESCYSGNAEMKTTAPQGIAMTNDTSAWEEKVTPVPAQIPAGMKSSTSLPSAVWEAKAGDDLRQTLQGWANRAGVAIDWQANNNGRVANDIRVAGTFEDAVQNLMAQNAAAMGLEANLMGGSAGQSAMSQDISYGAPTSLQPPRATGAGSARWSAPAGSNLQQVLSMWSKQAGVQMVWNSDYGFTVKSPVNDNSSYESALQSLLNQFANDSVRPAAQLNNDPATGQRLLLVESTRL